MEEAKAYIVIRIRGSAGWDQKVLDTLRMLNLSKPNRATIVKATPSIEGMLKKVEHMITRGPADVETVTYLLKKRGRVRGDKPLTEEYVKENTPYGSIRELAEALVNGEITMRKLRKEYGIKPFFRLHPPRKGFRGTVKRHRRYKGAYGYRGENIKDLVKRMA